MAVPLPLCCCGTDKGRVLEGGRFDKLIEIDTPPIPIRGIPFPTDLPKNPKYQSVLLVKSVRINGKPRHETILNLSQWSNEQVAACLEGPHFSEDDLYSTLDWLSKNQAKIEAKLFKKRVADSDKKPALFLYDIPSSYLEGVDNELAKYGDNLFGDAS